LARKYLTALAIALLLQPVASARAQDGTTRPAPRDALFEWDARGDLLRVSLSYRDVMSTDIERKLSRGLPTTVVFTAALFRPGSSDPLSTTAQTCKITWHVWEELYRVEVTRPGESQSQWTATVEGVMRRCAEARRLPAATRAQVPANTPVYLVGRVQVNPISPELLTKIQRWVSRPTGTGTAAAGDALFSTFTGLFLQRIGEAERVLDIVTRTSVPRKRP
jgi:hypothetical protein